MSQRIPTHYVDEDGVKCKKEWCRYARPGTTSVIAEVGCWHCRRYFMNPHNWEAGEQPVYPKQWDIDWIGRKVIRELKRLPTTHWARMPSHWPTWNPEALKLVLISKLTGEEFAIIEGMDRYDATKFLTFCLHEAEKEKCMKRQKVYFLVRGREFSGIKQSETTTTITFITDEGVTKELAKRWLVKEK